MSLIQNIYYRAFQFVFNFGARCLKWRRPIVVSGQGKLREIPGLLEKEGVKKPLVVSGPTVRRLLLPPLIEAMESAGIEYEIFSDVENNPTSDTCERIKNAYVAAGCDGIIAVGGGSPMDAAKAAAALIVRPGKTVQKLSGLLKVRRTIPPFIAVPTTAGTGSETTIAAVITDSKTHHKAAIMDLCLIPKYAVLDPELTLNLPPMTTAATGMDALTHAVEAYICWTYNTKESYRLAEEAVDGIFKYLERAYNNGHDIEAREKMLEASFKAGFAFTRAGVGNVHAIAHTLGGLYGTAHGLANAVILPIVLEDYGKVVYKKLARLADIAGIGGGSEEEKAKNFIAEIRAMNARFGIPTGFDFIKDEDVDTMINWALKEANPVYPVPVIYDRARCRAVINKIKCGRV